MLSFPYLVFYFPETIFKLMSHLHSWTQTKNTLIFFLKNHPAFIWLQSLKRESEWIEINGTGQTGLT